MTEVWFSLTVVLASFIQSFVGFGLGIVMISLMPFYMPDVTSSVSISNISSIFLSGQNALIHYRKQLSIRRILPILLPYFVSNTLTIVFLKDLKSDVFTVILGAFLVLYAIASLTGIFNFRMKRSVKNSIIAGSLSGILGGLFGTGGPPISIYLLQSSDDVSTYHADIQLYFALANLYSVAVRLINGQITAQVGFFALIALPATVVGALLGKWLLKKIDGKALKTYLYIFLIINGIVLIINTIRKWIV